jgi:hypothetical protein
VFGNALSNTQVMTGSVGITGSLAVAGAGTFSSSVTATSGNFVGLVDILNSTLPLRIVNTIATSNQQSWIKLRQAQTNLFGFDIGIDTTTGGDFFISRANGSDTITEAFRIARSNGNVGIGTTSPSYTLDVSGSGRFTSALLNTIQITNTGVAHGMTGWAPTNTVGSLGSYDAAGNFTIVGFSSTAGQSGLSLFGFIGVTDPTDAVPAILLNAGKKNGTAQQGLGTLETTFQFTNAGTPQLTILGSGNVGIGTASPTYLMHVVGTSNWIKASYSSATDTRATEINYVGIKTTASTAQSNNMQITMEGGYTADGSGAMVFNTGSPTAGERMRITAAGKIGMGVSMTAPGAQVTIGVSSVSTVGALASAALAINTNDNNTAVGNLAQISFGLQNVYTPAYIGYVVTTATAYTYGDLIFGTRSVNTDTAPTERMRISANGKVTITGPAHNQLTVKDSDASLELGADDSTMIGIGMVTAGDGITWFTGRHRPGSSGIYDEMNVARLSGSWVNLFRIYSNGNWDFAGSDISDIRLKENIKIIDYNATEKLLQLIPKSYNMIEHPTISKSGFIAQEVKEILPSFVTGIESENEYLGIDYNGILALTVKAIQEQQATIQSLQTRITQLENK